MNGSDPANVVLAGLIAALRAAPEIAAAFLVENDASPDLVKVWSHPPAAAGGEGAQGADGYPFLEVADIEVNSDEAIALAEEDAGGGSDGYLDDPSEVTATLRAYSRPRGGNGDAAELGGRPESARIIKAARKVLAGADVELEADEDGGRFRIVLAEAGNARHFTAQDGVTAISVLTVRFEVEPSEV